MVAPGNATTEVPPGEYHYLTEAEVIIAMVFIYTLDLAIITGNVMVIVAFLKDKQLQVTRNYYIFNLAVADLMIGLFVVPFYSSTVVTGTWPLGWPFCVIWNIAHNVTLLVSHLTIVFITYDRYLLVKDALEYSARELPKRAIFRILVAWLGVAMIKTTLIIWGEWYFSQEGVEPSCSPRSQVEVPYIVGLPLYDIIFTSACVVLEVFLPLLLIAFINIKVYRMIKQRRRRNSAVHNLIQQSLPSFRVMANISRQPKREQDKPDSRPSISLSPASNRLVRQKYTPFSFLAKLKPAAKVSDKAHPESDEEEQSIVEDIQQLHSSSDNSSCKQSPTASSVSKPNKTPGALEHQWKRATISYVARSFVKVTPAPDVDSITSISSIFNVEETSETGSHNDVASSPEKAEEDPAVLLKASGLIVPASLHPITALLSDDVTSARTNRNKCVRFDSTPQQCFRTSQARHSVILMRKVKKKQEQKAGFTISLFIVFFIFFKLPFGIILLVYAVCRTDCIDDNLYEAFTWLYYAKSLVNPFLYAFISKRFRMHCLTTMSKIPGLSRCLNTKN